MQRTIRTIATFAAFVLLASTTVEGARKADLTVSWGSANSVLVGTQQTYTVTVQNQGNKNAQGVTVDISLLKTNTSPNRYLLESVSLLDSACTLTGATITCNLGRIRKGRSESVSFDYGLRVTEQALTISARATTPTPEHDNTNNDGSLTIQSTYHATPITTAVEYTASHCTGQGLTEFLACEVSPSSISSHKVIFNADNTLSLPIDNTYTGSWSQPTPDALTYTYEQNSAVVASFSGKGSGDGCFEGITTFPNSAYNSAYKVCPPSP